LTITFRSAHSANAAVVSITQPAANDLIIVWAYNNGSTTVPSLPTGGGYTSLQTASPGGSANALRMGWKSAAGTETDTGTWTNATNISCEIYRAGGTATAGASNIGTGNSATLAYPSLTLQTADGSSWVAGGCGAKGATAGMNGTMTVLANNRTNQTIINALDSGSGVTAYAGENLVVTGNGRFIAATVEILDPDLNLFGQAWLQ
jgi:hypothetical protein